MYPGVRQVQFSGGLDPAQRDSIRDDQPAAIARACGTSSQGRRDDAAALGPSIRHLEATMGEALSTLQQQQRDLRETVERWPKAFPASPAQQFDPSKSAARREATATHSQRACFQCGGTDHIKRDCPDRRADERFEGSARGGDRGYLRGRGRGRGWYGSGRDVRSIVGAQPPQQSRLGDSSGGRTPTVNAGPPTLSGANATPVAHDGAGENNMALKGVFTAWMREVIADARHNTPAAAPNPSRPSSGQPQRATSASAQPAQ